MMGKCPYAMLLSGLPHSKSTDGLQFDIFTFWKDSSGLYQLESGDISISGSENLFILSSAFCGFNTKS